MLSRRWQRYHFSDRNIWERPSSRWRFFQQRRYQFWKHKVEAAIRHAGGLLQWRFGSQWTQSEYFQSALPKSCLFEPLGLAWAFQYHWCGANRSFCNWFQDSAGSGISVLLAELSARRYLWFRWKSDPSCGAQHVPLCRESARYHRGSQLYVAPFKQHCILSLFHRRLSPANASWKECRIPYMPCSRVAT